MNLLITFIVLNIVNVILQTAKSIATVKCGKSVAAIANAAAYGLYTIVIIYTVCDLPLWEKVLIVAGANFIGVYVVKIIEQKLSKEKLWKVEMAIPYVNNSEYIHVLLKDVHNIENNYNTLGKWHIFNCYCMTREQTDICKQIVQQYDGKISAYESKSLI